MNVHSKNGVRTIKLDKSEQRTIAKFAELMTDLAIFSKALTDLRDGAAGVADRIDSDGVFTPAPAKPEAKP